MIYAIVDKRLTEIEKALKKDFLILSWSILKKRMVILLKLGFLIYFPIKLFEFFMGNNFIFLNCMLFLIILFYSIRIVEN